jgi:hypothetical protein
MAWTNHRPPTVMEIRTFGPNVRISPITDQPLEDGYGALPDRTQEWQQTFAMDQKRGDELRKKITDMRAMETAKANLTSAQAEVRKDGIAVTS